MLKQLSAAKSKKLLPCLHCGNPGLHWKRRRLCWRCYRSRRIRAKYRPVCVCGLGARDRDFEGAAKKPARSCAAYPGTPAKIGVMRERAGEKSELHHEDDPRGFTPEVARRVMTAIDRLAAKLRGESGCSVRLGKIPKIGVAGPASDGGE